MQKNYFLTIVFTAIMILSGCNCKEDPQPVAKTDTELLLHNGVAWIEIAATLDPPLPTGGTLITDYYAQYTACEKDDTFLYYATNGSATNGSYTLNNPVKCFDYELLAYSGTWTLNGKDLVRQSNGKSTSLTILNLTATELKTKRVTWPSFAAHKNLLTLC